jgi:hypothetical protein
VLITEKEGPRVSIYPGRCFLHGNQGLELCFTARGVSYQVCIHDFGWLFDGSEAAMSYRYWGGHILHIRRVGEVVVCALTEKTGSIEPVEGTGSGGPVEKTSSIEPVKGTGPGGLAKGTGPLGAVWAGPLERELWRVEIDRMELVGLAVEALTCVS